jgi:hypothetical protein
MRLRTSEARLKKAQEMAKVGNWEYDIATGKYGGRRRHSVFTVLSGHLNFFLSMNSKVTSLMQK